MQRQRPLGGLLEYPLGLQLALVCGLVGGPALRSGAAELADELKTYPHQLVYEAERDGHWDLIRTNADGSEPVNLTKTPDVDELYPHVSPDGRKICFLVDEGAGDARSRTVYVMDADGTHREPVAKNGRDPCWAAGGTGIVYLKGEFEQYTVRDFASRGVAVFDLAARTHQPHPNAGLHHLYNICGTPDGKWYVATVHAGMGFKHAILAIEARGTKVYNLNIPGCRPDLSSDGQRIAWGANDYVLRCGDLDFSGPEPRVTNQRDLVKSPEPLEAYHVDWSPDGNYIAFSRGPKHKRLGPAAEMIGAQAEGWNIWVADTRVPNRWLALTTDGRSNKEPDWFPTPQAKP